MTTLSISAPKCLGFYSQSLQDKLYPFLGNGEKLTLDDAIALTGIASEGAWWSTQTKHPYGIGPILQHKESRTIDGIYFDGFDCQDEGLRAIVLELGEWLALARWTSELAELRLHDYTRAKVSEMAAQSPPIWEVL
ncbi:hypothetical protein [Laspinema olomoucense]|uniref:Uncharacterized protein n=1 Tax=Laspinema olomoucense D3b TaxID=2953688 RepID=A0ABT2NFU1_9CYAN|nr:hypothetical protein [Laspinema sp. D3b]MCT7981577.1 hypothetical protein [Laspinema sp. D3b]